MSSNIICDYSCSKFRLEQLDKIVQCFGKLVEKKEFDTLVFRGYSGAMVAPLLAHAYRKEMILIRKVGENCHSKRFFEGNLNCKKYIIIDDFIETGDTIRNIFMELENEFYENDKKYPECVGIFCYDKIREIPHLTPKLKSILTGLTIHSRDYDNDLHSFSV